MDDPKQKTSDDTQNVPIGFTPVSAPSKEIDVGTIGMSLPELPIEEVGKEVELPKEVSAVGVKQQPTHVPIPPNVASMGVKQTGPTTPLSTGSTVVLPLSQSQIAQGLKENILTSWRWLSEWCLRRLKQIRFLKTT